MLWWRQRSKRECITHIGIMSVLKGGTIGWFGLCEKDWRYLTWGGPEGFLEKKTLNTEG